MIKILEIQKMVVLFSFYRLILRNKKQIMYNSYQSCHGNQRIEILEKNMQESLSEGATRGVLQKKVLFKISEKFSRKHLCPGLFINTAASLRSVLSCVFCEISRNTFFTEHLRVAASEVSTFQSILMSSSSLDVLKISRQV